MLRIKIIFLFWVSTNLVFGQDVFSIKINNKHISDTLSCALGKNSFAIKIENNRIENLNILNAKVVLARHNINRANSANLYVPKTEEKNLSLVFDFETKIAKQWLHIIILYQNLAQPNDTLCYSKTITILENIDNYPKPYCLEVVFYGSNYNTVSPFHKFIDIRRGRKWLDIEIKKGHILNDTLNQVLTMKDKIMLEEIRKTIPLDNHYHKLSDKGRVFSDSVIGNRYYFNKILDDSVSIIINYKNRKEEFILPKEIFLCGGKIQLGIFKNIEKVQKRYAKYLKRLPEKDSEKGLMLYQKMPYLWTLKNYTMIFAERKNFLWIYYTSFLNPNVNKLSKILPLKKIKEFKLD
jgi:hypothetical protein